MGATLVSTTCSATCSERPVWKIEGTVCGLGVQSFACQAHVAERASTFPGLTIQMTLTPLTGPGPRAHMERYAKLLLGALRAQPLFQDGDIAVSHLNIDGQHGYLL